MASHSKQVNCDHRTHLMLLLELLLSSNHVDSGRNFVGARIGKNDLPQHSPIAAESLSARYLH